MIDIKEVADNADMIINGYAFTCEEKGIRVLNLNNTNNALIFDNKDRVIETTMDDIEISIVKDYLDNNREFLKVENAEIL